MILNLLFILRWWAGGDSNSRLPPCEDGTLTTELPAHDSPGKWKIYTSTDQNAQVKSPNQSLQWTTCLNCEL